MKEESGGRKQKIGNNLKAQNDRILMHLFSVSEGFEKSDDRRFTFNNLALDKLRRDKDSTSDLGKSTYNLQKNSFYSSFFSQTFQYGSWKSNV